MNAHVEQLQIARPATASPALPSGPLWQQPVLRDCIDWQLPIVGRLPALDQAERWVELSLGGKRHRFVQPITFTPYASSRPCSARCQFCSENLRSEYPGPAAAQLRPADDYFQGLSAALTQLTQLPMSWSLSGLENTDDLDWLFRLLAVLSAAESGGVAVESRVMYSNLAGFGGSRSDDLIAALHSFGLHWIEVSRHHHQAERNQRIMRFRDAVPVASNDAFEMALRRIGGVLYFKMVCVVQRGGVDDVAQVLAYLDWALSLGAGQVVFRELARMDGDYRINRTARYIAEQRIDVGSLLAACLQHPEFRARWQPRRGTRGYYFSNLVLGDDGGREIVFEAADYGDMHQRHDSERVYKLIYFANGELSADWQPGRRPLWRFDGYQ